MKRKKYDPKFKAKVAFEVAKGLRTANELAAEYGVHPTMLTKWKKELISGMPDIFANSNKKTQKEKNEEQLLSALYQKIGQLEVELDWLRKKSEMIS